MKSPKINFVLHGRKDRNGCQVLKIRFSYRYQTNYIHTSIRLHPSEWDAASQRIISPRGKTPAHSASVANLNAWIESQKSQFFQFVSAGFIHGDSSRLSFESFRKIFEPEKEYRFRDAAEALIQQDLDSKNIAKNTADTYRAALSRFFQVVGEDIYVSDITKDKIRLFISKLETAQNNNVANQYATFVKVVYRRVLKEYSLKFPDPFEGIKLRIVRLSNKKTLTIPEYQKLYAAMIDFGPEHVYYDILRRFLIMCRGGIRWIDTTRIQQKHFYPVSTRGYFMLQSQKTGGTYICPMTDRDMKYLVRWQPNGHLFGKTYFDKYSDRLKVVTKQIIGRPITSHYGRHFAGDFILNSEEMQGMDDVKSMLGISTARVAEIYAKRDLTSLLDKFWSAMSKLE